MEIRFEASATSGVSAETPTESETVEWLLILFQQRYC